MEKWRIIFDKPYNGSMNMAIDEAILHAVKEGEAPPTIRFYQWEPSCVSLGYFQKINEQIDLNVVNDLNFDVVRRPTGGRSVLHHQELTYSIIVPESHPKIPKEVVKAYKILSNGLLIGLKNMGYQAEMVPLDKDNSIKGSAACFDAPSWYELVVNNKKVIGSAQMRKEGILLQHGSIPLYLDTDLLVKVLKFPSKEAEERIKKVLDRKAAGLCDINPDICHSIEDSMIYLQNGFQSALNVNLESDGLTGRESLLTTELYEEKYNNDDWTYKR